MHRRLACPPYLVNESAFATRLRRTLPPSLFHCALKRRRERVRGIEPPCAAWEAAVLPLNYTRVAICDFRFSIADCNPNKIAHATRLATHAPENRSLPRNHIVGCIEICALCRVLAQGPGDYSDVQG